MARNLIYTVNSTGAAAPIGSTVPVGSIIRRYGKCISADGESIVLLEPGYYLVTMTATATAAAVGNVELGIQQDGVAVPGATATETVATAGTEYVNLSFAPAVRVRCCLALLVLHPGVTVVRPRRAREMLRQCASHRCGCRYD